MTSLSNGQTFLYEDFWQKKLALAKEYPIDLHQIIRLLRKHNYKKFTLFITFCR